MKEKKNIATSAREVPREGHLARNDGLAFASDSADRVGFGWRILIGDCIARLKQLPDRCVHTVVTSPPYWGLRDYGAVGQLGLEEHPDDWIAGQVAVFREVRRVLRDDGTVWLNLGDSYAQGGRGDAGEPWLEGGRHNLQESRSAQRAMAKQNGREKGFKDFRAKAPRGLKPKDLIGQPWSLAFALRADGWYLRSDVIWFKPNPMPESITDRPTKAHEYVFLLSKSERYFYDNEAVREPYAPQSEARRKYVDRSDHVSSRRSSHQPGASPQQASEVLYGSNPAGRNLRDVWTINSEPFSDGHFATFPTKLVEPCIKASTSARGVCPRCAAPYSRVIARGAQDPDWIKACGANADGTYHGQSVKDYEGTGAQTPGDVKARILEGMTSRSTVGWEPTCARVMCGSCRGNGLDREMTARLVIAGCPPLVVKVKRKDPLYPRCQNPHCRGRGWWAVTCSELEQYQRWQEQKDAYAGMIPDYPEAAHFDGRYSYQAMRACGDPSCAHERRNHGPDLASCSRCKCRRFRWTVEADPIAAIVLDPYSGAATTGLVARRLGRRYLGTELNPEYAALSAKRLEEDQVVRDFGGVKPASEAEAKTMKSQLKLGEW